jgi:hypothetical protein
MADIGVSVGGGGGMGQRAAPLLGENGIKAVRGAAGPGREAVRGRFDRRTPDRLEARDAPGDRASGGRRRRRRSDGVTEFSMTNDRSVS